RQVQVHKNNNIAANANSGLSRNILTAAFTSGAPAYVRFASGSNVTQYPPGILGNTNLNLNADEIYFGGTRSGSNGSGYLDAEVAEFLVYDYRLTCTQIRTLEDALRVKWNTAFMPYSPQTCSIG